MRRSMANSSKWMRYAYNDFCLQRSGSSVCLHSFVVNSTKPVRHSCPSQLPQYMKNFSYDTADELREIHSILKTSKRPDIKEIDAKDLKPPVLPEEPRG